jgi:hypothetical protein
MKNAAETYEADGDDQYVVAIRPDDKGGFATRKFYCQRPICDIREMAWATSMQCRFTGHVQRRYSVAQHGVLVATLMYEPAIAMRGGTPYEGLMHDAHEGYVSDMAAPWKVTVKDYRPFETRIEHAMREQFGLPPTVSAGVKFADWCALYIEAEQLLGHNVTADWLQPEPGMRDYALKLYEGTSRYDLQRCWEPREAYDRFLTEYRLLRPLSV